MRQVRELLNKSKNSIINILNLLDKQDFIKLLYASSILGASVFVGFTVFLLSQIEANTGFYIGMGALTLVLVILNFSGAYITARNFKENLSGLETSITDFINSDRALTELDFSNKTYEISLVSEAVNEVIANYEEALNYSNNFVEHLRVVSERSLSYIDNLTTNLSQHDVETKHVLAAVGKVSGLMQEMSYHASKVISAAVLAKEKVHISKELVVETRHTTDSLIKELGHTYDAMQKINGVGNDIGALLASIRDIVNMANKIALGASIEVARAGDASFFMRVAVELKSLTDSLGGVIVGAQNVADNLSSHTKFAAKSLDNSSILLRDEIKKFSNLTQAVENVATAIRNLSNIAVKLQFNETTDPVQNNLHNLDNITKFSVLKIAEAKDLGRDLVNMIEDYQDVTS